MVINTLQINNIVNMLCTKPSVSNKTQQGQQHDQKQQQQQQNHYTQVSPVTVNYFGDDSDMINKRRFRDHYYLDSGFVSIITSIEQCDDSKYRDDCGYCDTDIHEYVEFLARLDSNKYVLSITRKVFTKVIPRILPSNTPYPTDTYFTKEDIIKFCRSPNDSNNTNDIKDVEVGSGCGVKGEWSLSHEYESGDRYVHTIFKGVYLHGPVYIIEFNEPKYLGSYNYGYKDSVWIEDDKQVTYAKGTPMVSRESNGKTLINIYPHASLYIENSSLLLWSVTEDQPDNKPQIIDNKVIVTSVFDYY